MIHKVQRFCVLRFPCLKNVTSNSPSPPPPPGREGYTTEFLVGCTASGSPNLELVLFQTKLRRHFPYAFSKSIPFPDLMCASEAVNNRTVCYRMPDLFGLFLFLSFTFEDEKRNTFICSRGFLKTSHLSNTPTNLCMALLKFLFCFVLYCYAFVQYCYLKSIQYNAMHKFVGALDNALKPTSSFSPKLSNSIPIFRPNS